MVSLPGKTDAVLENHTVPHKKKKEKLHISSISLLYFSVIVFLKNITMKWMDKCILANKVEKLESGFFFRFVFFSAFLRTIICLSFRFLAITVPFTLIRGRPRASQLLGEK